MKKLILGLGIITLLMSCDAVNFPANNGNVYIPQPNADPNTATPETEREYAELIKNFKPQTAEVLTDLFNDNNPKNPNTSIVITNISPCNIVITVKGTNFLQKIPIGAGKTEGIMVKKDTYRISGLVCRANYDEIKYLTESFVVKLNNK